jgi:hypothetical protein
VNCWVNPLATDGFAGVTAIVCKTAGVTVNVVDPLIDPEVALIVVDPVATVLAKPALLMVATAVAEDVHVAVLVRFCWLPSVNVPVAVNCCVNPLATDGFAGVTAIVCKTAGVTVSAVEPLIDPDVALIVVDPVATVLAKPALLMVATAVAEDVHVAVLVRFCWLPSVNVPVAVNCCVNPLATDGFAGVTAIVCKTAGVTVSVVEPLIDPEVALIVVDPVATVLAKPALLMVATVVAEDVHVAVLVRFCVLLSVYVPVAVNCCINPLATDGFAGVTLIELKAMPTPVNEAVCGLLLALSVTVKVPVRVPVAVGLKVTLIVQLAKAANDVPQLLVWA